MAGVRALLAPFAGRVALLEIGTAMNKPSSVDVILYEPVRQTPTSQAMLRDLVRASQKSAIVYSWRDKEGTSTGSFAAHISKALPAPELVSAIESLHDGGGVGAGRRIPSDHGPLKVIRGSQQRDYDLTPREAEILALVTQGLTNSEIGGQLYLSINSVKTYIRAAYRKIEVTRRAQAVAWGMEHGLAPLAEADVVGG